MANIRFISTTNVKPVSDHDFDDQNHDFSPRIELTPWDLRLLQFEYIQAGLLFHKPEYSSSFTTTFVDHLKSTFSRALAIFYPLAGRLIAVENNADNNDNDNDNSAASFFINCNGDGALFIHAAIDGVTVADVLEPVIIPDDIVYSFFPMTGVLNCEAAFSELPLLAAQVTELVDGVFVACTMSHCACDGASFWHFFNIWSEIARRGGVSRCCRPVFSRDRYFEGVIDLPIRNIPISRNKISDKRYVLPPNLQQRMFHFSKEKIAELKAKANAEIGITNSNEIMISSLQALMAHLWISVTRNRRLDLDETVSYMVIMGLRQRFRPPLPEEYFGSSIRAVSAKCTAKELLEQGLGWAARKINRMIASQTAMEVRKSLKDWAKSPVLPQMGKFPANTLMTGSSPRFTAMISVGEGR
ncbi:hypothetical protein TIFTF001_002755 [Ficus carica]|uniref:Transferase n=1 Tax=Ficus carica TaxID=3494 RepID=A0AA87Z6Q1_FICCA|nr:hypothetical protein TIFTF001_002755 [Ficus carica]